MYEAAQQPVLTNLTLQSLICQLCRKWFLPLSMYLDEQKRERKTSLKSITLLQSCMYRSATSTRTTFSLLHTCRRTQKRWQTAEEVLLTLWGRDSNNWWRRTLREMKKRRRRRGREKIQTGRERPGTSTSGHRNSPSRKIVLSSLWLHHLSTSQSLVESLTSWTVHVAIKFCFIHVVCVFCQTTYTHTHTHTVVAHCFVVCVNPKNNQAPSVSLCIWSRLFLLTMLC